MPSDDNIRVTLPSGRQFRPSRPRSRGTLTAEERAWCRANGVPLAYDPVQLGWVALMAADDLHDCLPPLSASLAAVAEGAGDFVFRPWHDTDVDAFRGLLDDPEVWRYLPETYPAPLTEATARDLIAVSALDGHHEVRAVEHRGHLIGQVRLEFSARGTDRSEAEISYWLGAQHWGKGLGRAIVAAATRRAFRLHPDLSMIVAWVHPQNAASAKLLVRAGYRTQAAQRGDGWHCYAIRRDESYGTLGGISSEASP